MTEFDPAGVIAILGKASGAPTAAVEAVQTFGLRALLGNQPTTAEQISIESHLSIEDVLAGIAGLARSGRIEIDGDRIIGVGGLTASTTEHTLVLSEATMHTWCALDAIGIPVALGIDAEITTTCPQCTADLSVSVSDGVASSDRAVTLFCPTGPCHDVRADFCVSANLFCDANHLRLWHEQHEAVDGHALDLSATSELGREMWGSHRGP